MAPDKVKCIDCAHWNLKGSPLGRLECGLCKVGPKGTATTFGAFFQRACPKYSRAEAATIGRRYGALKVAQSQSSAV